MSGPRSSTQAAVLRGREVTPPATLPDQIRRMADRTPEAIAVRQGDDRLTYRELIEAAENLALRIRKVDGSEGSIAIIATPPGIDYAVAVLGAILGRTFASPLHPELPESRVSRILELANPSIVIGPGRERMSSGRDGSAAWDLDRLADGARHLSVDPEPVERTELVTTLDDPCYTLFTSGSTGVPKGVRMHQLPVANLARFDVERDPGPWRTAQLAPLGFDVAFQEMFGTLGGGGELVVVPLGLRRDIAGLVRFLAEESIERVLCVPLLSRFLARASNLLSIPLPALRELVVGGETLRVDDELREFARRSGGIRLINQLGAAETIQTSFGDLGADPDQWADLPELGGPVDGVVIRVVDDQGQVVPCGLEGDIEIGGVAPALGYLDGPGDRFRETSDGRWYNTRDRGVVHEDGRFEYRGRLDHQVKIRGFRVELSEVEAAIAGLPDIEDAAVSTIEGRSGERILVSLVVPRSEDVRAEDVVARLRAQLPEWMVPLRLELVADLPQNGNSKVDRREVARRFEEIAT